MVKARVTGEYAGANDVQKALGASGLELANAAMNGPGPDKDGNGDTCGNSLSS